MGHVVIIRDAQTCHRMTCNEVHPNCGANADPSEAPCLLWLLACAYRAATIPQHLAQADNCWQVPSWRADPLTPACDQWCEFPVSDRPNAVKQFLHAAKADPTLIKVRCVQC